MKIPYIVRDVFTRGEYITLSKPVKANMINQYKILEDYKAYLPSVFDLDYEQFNLTLVIQYNSLLKHDGYQIKVNKLRNEIVIQICNERALMYAFELLNSMIEIEETQVLIPQVYIKDHASFSLRGIIEGFYGVPWSHEARLDVISTMSQLRMNTFIYAPKDDLYHRENWRELYPNLELSQLLEYKNRCEQYNIDFYYSISPGKDFNYTKLEEFTTLFYKLKQLIKEGVNHFSLLLDDIDYKLQGESLKRFKRPGIAHAYITNKLYDFLNSELDDFNLIMCPTEYFQNYDTEYRNDLKNQLHQEVKVFWTGYNTVAEVITSEDGEIVRDSFGHDLILWENYPVNDFSKERIYLGPLVNRDTQLSKTHAGMVANPMNQWYASKFSVTTIAHYMWNSEKYDPKKSLNIAISEWVNPECYDAMHLFVELNENSVLSIANKRKYKSYVDNNQVDGINEIYKELERSIYDLQQHLDENLKSNLQPWINRAQKEINLWTKIYEKQAISKEDIVIVLEDQHELGTTLMLDYLELYYPILDYNPYKKKPRFNFWGI